MTDFLSRAETTLTFVHELLDDMNEAHRDDAFDYDEFETRVRTYFLDIEGYFMDRYKNWIQAYLFRRFETRPWPKLLDEAFSSVPKDIARGVSPSYKKELMKEFLKRNPDDK